VTARRACALLVLAGAAFAVPAAHSALPPAALLQSLLNTPVTASSLPAGYGSPSVITGTPSARAKSHHVLGEVDVLATKAGTAGARVLYIVFPTHADALADWNDGLRHSPKTRLLPPTSVPQPAVMFNLPATATMKYGATIVGHLTGNLIIEVETSSTASIIHGDVSGASALAKFGLAHLQTLGGQRA
jgi:hypothetical protein